MCEVDAPGQQRQGAFSAQHPLRICRAGPASSPRCTLESSYCFPCHGGSTRTLRTNTSLSHGRRARSVCAFWTAPASAHRSLALPPPVLSGLQAVPAFERAVEGARILEADPRRDLVHAQVAVAQIVDGDIAA